MKIIRGITWNHSRALPPLVAAGQRYEELTIDVRIKWEKRTLHEFGHKPIDQLIDDFDLIVIDHPWAGFCFEKDLVVDLNTLLSKETYQKLSSSFIGPAFESYQFDNKLLAIPIDLATPVPSWRPDLFKDRQQPVPSTWEEVIHLADRKQAMMPGFTADLFLNWLMLLHALEANPFESDATIAEKSKATEAMDLLKRLAEPMPEAFFDWNPIMVAELMTREDRYLYCPFAYSYGNYSRPSFCEKPLQYGNLITLNGQPLQSILGGTGLAVSRKCKDKELALDFSLYCASDNVQEGIYTYSGGQPANLRAWKSEELNRFSGQFFEHTLSSHQDAILRPRYNGYVPLQETIGACLQQYLKENDSSVKILEKINKLYRESL